MLDAGAGIYVEGVGPAEDGPYDADSKTLEDQMLRGGTLVGAVHPAATPGSNNPAGSILTERYWRTDDVGSEIKITYN